MLINAALVHSAPARRLPHGFAFWGDVAHARCGERPVPKTTIERLSFRALSTVQRAPTIMLLRLRSLLSGASAVSVLACSNLALLALILWRDGQLRKLLRRLRTARSTAELGGLLGRDYEPPLPAPIAEALERSCLCFLATSRSESPHLSLMRFSYCQDLETPREEVLIMTTQRATKKYEMLAANQNVALLVHDFEGDAGNDASNYTALDGRSRYSITLNGVAREARGALAEQYRAIHLKSNAAYKQFIVGDDIAIITVHLQRARVCDVNDRVHHFRRNDSGREWTECGHAEGASPKGSREGSGSGSPS